MKKSVSVIMLVYNEAEIIEKVVKEYYDKVVSKLDHCEFIIAEDGSTDGTKEILNRVAQEIPIQYISGDERKGYVKALRDAILLPQNELVFFSDSSGKHDPDDFWALYEKTDEYDIVSGYKEKRKDPFPRILMTKVFNGLVNIYFGTHFRDIDSGFKCIPIAALKDVAQDKWISKDLISFELMVRFFYRGYSILEVPVSHKKRENGASRGLPLKKIPRVIFRTLANFKAVKKDARAAAGK